MDKVKYFYVRTTDDTIIEISLYQFPEVFAGYEEFTEAADQEDIQRTICKIIFLT